MSAQAHFQRTGMEAATYAYVENYVLLCPGELSRAIVHPIWLYRPYSLVTDTKCYQ